MKDIDHLKPKNHPETTTIDYQIAIMPRVLLDISIPSKPTLVPLLQWQRAKLITLPAKRAPPSYVRQSFEVPAKISLLLLLASGSIAHFYNFGSPCFPPLTRLCHESRSYTRTNNYSKTKARVADIPGGDRERIA